MRQIWGGVSDFVLAWRLLTVIQLPFGPDDLKRPAGYAAGYYPLVGLLLGLLLAGAGQLFSFLLPEGLAAAVLLVFWVGLTGMLHLDGFMDACDGLLPPRDPARRLEIMQDSRVGAFGVVGVVLLLLLKFNGLAALPSVNRWSVLITVPVLARWAMTWVMARYPPARTEGLSVFFGTGLGWGQVGFASAVAIVVSTSLLGLTGLLLLGLTWLTATLMARLAMARIGGLTGDIYGATGEMVETVLLISVAVLK
jgi:adenosylcobinamide-GDP ribazoletransferase